MGALCDWGHHDDDIMYNRHDGRSAGADFKLEIREGMEYSDASSSPGGWGRNPITSADM